MPDETGRMKKIEAIRRRGRGLAVVIFAVVVLAGFASRAEEFGEISVSAAAIYTGNTYHGYGEMEVTLENHSLTKAHEVTISVPDNSWSSGNSIGRITPAGVVTEFSKGITPGGGPCAITAGPDGNVWFSEVNANYVGRVTPDGRRPRSPSTVSTRSCGPSQTA